MTSIDMTSTVSTVAAAGRHRGKSRLLATAVHFIGTAIRAIRSAWNDIAEAGQFGPTGEEPISRQTGARV